LKKILQINSIANIGSTGRIVENIGVRVLNNGWESHIAYGRNAKTSKSKLLKIGNTFDVYSHVAKARIFDQSGFGSKLATIEFVKQIKTIDPDIIHLHNIHGYYINIEILFNYLANSKKRVVWTLHDCWSLTGHCSYFDYVKCNKWQTECYECPQSSEYPKSFRDRSQINYKIKKKLFNSIENLTLVPVSNWLNNVLKNSFLSGYPTHVISNGVNINVFKPSYKVDVRNKYNIPEKKILVGVANVWEKRKGLSDYIKLSKALSNDFQIILIGLTNKQILELPSNVIGIKYVEDIQELICLYTISEIVLNLSYEETFGMTTIEGFACGTPSIVYNNTASPELITHKTGMVVEPGDIKGVVEAVHEIVNTEEKYYSNCIERARKHYDNDVKIGSYIKLYENTISQL